jgi:hypothetical protein
MIWSCEGMRRTITGSLLIYPNSQFPFTGRRAAHSCMQVQPTVRQRVRKQERYGDMAELKQELLHGASQHGMEATVLADAVQELIS